MLKLIVPDAAGSPFQQGRSMPFTPVEDSQSDQAARGLLRFAEKTGEIADHEMALKRTVDLATGAAAYQTVLDQERLKLDADPDHGTRSERFQKFAQAELDKRTEGMNAETKALFVQRVSPLASGMELSVRHQARTDAKDEAVVVLRASNDDLIKKAADAKNPLEREALLAQVKGNVDNALAINMLSPAQHKAELQQTLVKADQAAALKLIRDNPGAAEKLLAGGKALPNLDVVTREKLIDSAKSEGRARLSQSLALEARAERVETRRLTLLAESTAKEVDARASDGTLTREDLEKARPFLKSDDYRTGLKTLKGGATTDDRDTLVNLTGRLDKSDIGKDIDDAYLRDKISKPTYDALRNKNRELLKDDGPASPYKRGRGLIGDTLEPGMMFDASSAKIARYGRSQALDEFDTFVEGNRDAIKKDPQIAIERANDIVRRYRLINFDEIGVAVGLPVGFAGTRESIGAEDIKSAGQRVLQLWDKRQISEAEKNLELKRLDQWDEIIKQRDAANAEKPGPQSKPRVGDGGRR